MNDKHSHHLYNIKIVLRNASFLKKIGAGFCMLSLAGLYWCFWVVVGLDFEAIYQFVKNIVLLNLVFEDINFKMKIYNSISRKELTMPLIKWDPFEELEEIFDKNFRVSRDFAADIYDERDETVEDKNYYRKEIAKGYFERVITLPANVKADKTMANYQDGVLTITMPREEKLESSKKIKVNKK
jgi:HSP20 family molecular chaperone IbpA